MNVKKKNNKDKNEESAYNSSPTFPQDTIKKDILIINF